jgi:hypothetical protein
MRTVTLNDLETRLPVVLGWLRRGEDVMMKGEPANSLATAEGMAVGP